MSETELIELLREAARMARHYRDQGLRTDLEKAAEYLQRRAGQPRPEPVARVTQMNFGSGALIERLTNDVKLGMNLYAEQPRPADEMERHPDEIAVDKFAAAMKEKLARKRTEGRGGWEDKDRCSLGYLRSLLIEHLNKGDPVDVGNFVMMIWNRDERVSGIDYQQPRPAVPEDKDEKD